MTPRVDTETYDDVRRAIDDARIARGEHSRKDDPGGWIPQWIQVVLAVGAVIVSVVLAYGALDKRIALIEQALLQQREKLDLIIYQQNGKR